MNTRELEALIAAHGGSPSQLDKITRGLRAAMKLPVGGRGLNAPSLDHSAAAWVLLAYMGSEVASQPGRTVMRTADVWGNGTDADYRVTRWFPGAVQLILADPATASTIKEIRFAQNSIFAAIAYKDGRVETFGSHPAGFRIEGVATGELIEAIATGLRANGWKPDDTSDILWDAEAE